MTADTDATPWTVARLLTWTRAYLTRQGVESPRLCAELLLAHALNCERIRLFTRHDEVPGEDVRARFRGLVKEAAGGRPIAYLTGVKEFFSLPFEVTPEVLIPRPETEILVERTIDLVRKQGPADAAILDLGAGSGCIAVSLARHLPNVRLFASDVSEAALCVARRNAERHGVSDRIVFRMGSGLAAWRAGADGSAPRVFDLIVCNPPYVAAGSTVVEPQVRAFEPATALFAGADGLDVIRVVLADAPRHLGRGGQLLMEIGYDQAGALRELLARGPWEDVTFYRDGGGHERVVRARRTAAEAVQVA